MSAGKIRPVRRACAFYFYMGILYGSFSDGINIRQYRTIPALRLKHRSGSCGTASALPKCSIMSGCGTRIVLRGQKPLAFCDRCPCFGSLFPPLAALTFAASSIICAFGLASAAPRSPYRHLELCGICHKSFLPYYYGVIFLTFYNPSLNERHVPLYTSCDAGETCRLCCVFKLQNFLGKIAYLWKVLFCGAVPDILL